MAAKTYTYPVTKQNHNEGERFVDKRYDTGYSYPAGSVLTSNVQSASAEASSEFTITIYGSNDNSNWTTLISYGKYGTGSKTYTTTAPYRYIRFYMSHPYGGGSAYWGFSISYTFWTLALSASPSAGGSVSGGGTYKGGTTVSAKATANSGYRFVNWTQSGTQKSTSATYSFALNADTTLVANFKQRFTLSLSASPTAGGTVSGGGTFDTGTSVTAVATANSGYRFVNWTQNGTVKSTNASYTFSLGANTTLVANFVARQNITVSANTGEYGSVSGGGTYDQGATVTLVATPYSAYRFKEWQKNGVTVSTSSTYSFTVDGASSWVAIFEPQLNAYVGSTRIIKMYVG